MYTLSFKYDYTLCLRHTALLSAQETTQIGKVSKPKPRLVHPTCGNKAPVECVDFDVKLKTRPQDPVPKDGCYFNLQTYLTLRTAQLS